MDNVMRSLVLMGKGMAAVFTVMVLICLMIALLSPRKGKGRKGRDGEDEGPKRP